MKKKKNKKQLALGLMTMNDVLTVKTKILISARSAAAAAAAPGSWPKPIGNPRSSWTKSRCLAYQLVKIPPNAITSIARPMRLQLAWERILFSKVRGWIQEKNKEGMLLHRIRWRGVVRIPTKRPPKRLRRGAPCQDWCRSPCIPPNLPTVIELHCTQDLDTP